MSSAPAQPSKKTKGKSGGKAVSTLEDIIRIVQEAPLSKDQMQALVENVLSRMESEDSWTTKVSVYATSMSVDVWSSSDMLPQGACQCLYIVD